MSANFHTQLLDRELRKRQVKNARYSLRAFAVFLDLHPSALSRVLQGKQDVSVPSAINIIKKLSLDHQEQIQFIASVAEQKYRNAMDALLAGTLEPEAQVGRNHADLESDLPLATSGYVDQTPTHIAIQDLEGRVMSINPSVVQMPWMTDVVNAIGKNLEQIGFPAALAAKLNAQNREVARTKLSISLDYYADGEDNQWYRRVASPLFGADNEVNAILVHSRNITEETRAWRKAKLLQELLLDLVIAKTRTEIDSIRQIRRAEAETIDAEDRALQKKVEEFCEKTLERAV